MVIDHLDLVQDLQAGRTGLGSVRVNNPGEGGGDVAAGHRPAVVERDALTQFHSPGHSVRRRRDLGGQQRLQLEVFIPVEQRLVQVHHAGDVRGADGDVRVEGVRRAAAGEADPQMSAALGRAAGGGQLVGLGAAAGGEHRAEAEGHAAAEDVPAGQRSGGDGLEAGTRRRG